MKTSFEEGRKRNASRAAATFSAAVLLVAMLPSGASAEATPKMTCSQLKGLVLDGVTSIVADEVLSGSFKPPVGAEIAGVHPMCRVQLAVSAVPGSKVNVEVWLPLDHWNGRLLGTGNSGGAGRIYYPPMRAGLNRGFVTANSDLGTAPAAKDAVNHPEAWVDFGHRATHVMTILAKQVSVAYFGAAPRYSYFWGNSTGGQNAMSEVQRYPEDYNGILAGGAAMNRTHLHSYFVWNYQATQGAAAFSPADLKTLNEAVLHACAGKDGGAPTDDFLTDPRACKFDPATVPVCDSNHPKKCLTQPQVDGLKKIYAGPVNPKTGERIYAPMPFGTEQPPIGIPYQQDKAHIAGVLYPFQWTFGSSFDPLHFDFSKDQDAVDQKLSAALNANDPDLTKFQKRGGKLIMFEGTADGIVPFPDQIAYYDRVVEFERTHAQANTPADALAATQSFFRYYLVPGMGHGGQGPGLNSFGQLIGAKDDDVLHALELWVEKGIAPGEFLATGWNDATPAKGIRLQRRVCPYPQFATYTGGDASKETSFVCKARPIGEVALPAQRYER